MKVRFAAAVTAFLISSSAQAAPVIVQNSELPSAIQSQFGSLVFSSYHTTNMAAFRYVENSVAKWLIRYNVTAPSYESYSSYDSWTGMSTSSNTPLTGNLWLTANQSYNLADASHQFTLYTDKVTPTPLHLNFPQTFGLSSSALLAGNAFYKTYFDEYWQQQSLSNLNLLPFTDCIECPLDINLNLLMLKYSDVGGIAQLSFDASDTRNLLYKAIDIHPDFGTGSSSLTQKYYVQSVPLPTGLWLLASGFLGLGVLAKKQRT